MERTTSRSSAAGISSAIVKQADGSINFQQCARSVNPFSVSPQVPWWSRAGDAPLMAPHRNLVEKPCQRGHGQSLLSPPSFFPSPSELVSMAGFRFGSGAVRDHSLFVDGHTTTLQSVPLPFLPTLGKVDLQVSATTSLPAAFGAQPWQRMVPSSEGLVSTPSFGSGSAVDLQVPAASTFPAVLVGQARQPPQSGSLVSALGSRSRSAAKGNNFTTIKGHTTMSQSLPSSFFPTCSTVDLQVSAATPFPAALGGQQWQGMAAPSYGGLVSGLGSRSGSAALEENSTYVNGHGAASESLLSSFFPTLDDGQAWQGLAPPPSWTALGLPACPSQEGALEQMAAWQQSEMPFFLPAAVSGQQPSSSSDNRVRFTQPSSNYELPPLPPSLRMPPLEEESTYNMLSAINDGTIPWHYGDSSMGIGSSIPAVPNLTARAMKGPMPPPMPQSSSQGAGAGSSNFIGFTAQSSLNSELAALRAGLQAHLQLPVKQEHISAVAARCGPEFISPIGNKEDRLDRDAIQHSMPQNSIARGLVSWESPKVSGNTPYCKNSNSTPKLSQPLTLRAGTSSSRSHATGVIFTDAEKEIIKNDKKLQDLLRADLKRVKRILSNRMSAAKRKGECKVETLERKRKTSSAELQLVQGQRAELETHQKEKMRMTTQEMERQVMLKDAVSGRLQAHIQAQNLIKLDGVSSQKNKCLGSSRLPPTKQNTNN